jgi:hypothetical protein
MFQPERFSVNYKKNAAAVEVLSIAGQTVYRVRFSDQTQQLILTRATHQNTNRFWTSIPEGRQELAEEVGALIEQYIRQKV